MNAQPDRSRASVDAPLRASAGFRHSAFTFGCESMVAKSNINGAKIPPGQLINFVQKGILYTELERSVGEDGSELNSTEPFSLLRAAADGKPSAADGPVAKKQRSDSSASAMETDGAPAAAAADGGGSREVTTLSDEEVTTLEGHTSEVFICAWSPTSSQLASGSGDSTARIWRVPETPSGKAQVTNY